MTTARNDDSPVFESIGQALHVSFMVMANEARQGGPLRKALIQMMDQQRTLTAKQRDWMNQLIGEKSEGTVDFSGLTADEIRGQCAMVTQIVKDHLTEPEMHAIRARFIPTAMEEIGRDDGRPVYRYYFSQDRVTSLMWLSQWIAPNFAGINRFLLDHLVTRTFAERREVRHTFRDLADRLGGNHMTYARLHPKVAAHLQSIEVQALMRLTPLFQRTGLIAQVTETC
jgi:hypothetical protein